jgi:hypothetical protein
MRILCDQNVPEKYLHALADGNATVTTVEDVLEHDATDSEIAAYAETNGWVVFTNDDDFYVDGGDHGLLFYSQIEDPSPGAVVEAVERIDAAYENASEIVETVPDGWA